MWDYTDKVMDLFHNPHNMGPISTTECGPEEAVAIGEVGSIVCGDALRLHLRIDKKTDKILNARFQTFGCASAIASSSALTDLIVGMTVYQAINLTNREIADYLGGLPEEKMHCSVMGQEALESAVSNYLGVPIRPHEEDDGPLICTCFAVSEPKIRRLIRANHLTSAEQVTNYIKAGGGCGSCLSAIDDLLAEVTAESREEPDFGDLTPAIAAAKPANVIPSSPSSPTTLLTNLQKISLIQKVLEEEVRPILAMDGGDVELYDVEGDTVKVLLKGACDSCPSVSITLKMAIEKRLRDRVLPSLIVEAIL